MIKNISWIFNLISIQGFFLISLVVSCNCFVSEQLLQEETEASESDWAELSETVSSLKNMIHPSAAVIITEQTNAQRQR